MRGCVSAGMIAAVSTLGLMDTFDAVYGSSAGSLVGAYAIAGQVTVACCSRVADGLGCVIRVGDRALLLLLRSRSSKYWPMFASRQGSRPESSLYWL